MPTIAIIGAGPGLGLAIARRFGREGFQVALISRNQDKLDGMAARLGAEQIEAAGFAADLGDRPALSEALQRATERFAAIDVLEYSPAPTPADSDLARVSATEVTVDSVQAQIDFYVYGAIEAVRQVLPGMVERGSGTLLFTTGASSTLVFPAMGNVGIAGAALRNWVLALNASLKEKGIYVAHVPLATFIGSGGPETQADVIAEIYWNLYTERDEAEHLYSTL